MSDEFLLVVGGIKEKFDILCNFFFLVFVRLTKGSVYWIFIILFQGLLARFFQKEVILKKYQPRIFNKLKTSKGQYKIKRNFISSKFICENTISAAVISRKTGSWWRQITLNKGSKDGVEIGSTVIGPGGLLGRVSNTSLFTSSVKLLTSPESKVGVWIDRIQINGLLVGVGDDFPSLILYSKDADIKVGDFVSSSPASTLLPQISLLVLFICR